MHGKRVFFFLYSVCSSRIDIIEVWNWNWKEEKEEKRRSRMGRKERKWTVKVKKKIEQKGPLMDSALSIIVKINNHFVLSFFGLRVWSEIIIKINTRTAYDYCSNNHNDTTIKHYKRVTYVKKCGFDGVVWWDTSGPAHSSIPLIWSSQSTASTHL